MDLTVKEAYVVNISHSNLSGDRELNNKTEDLPEIDASVGGGTGF